MYESRRREPIPPRVFARRMGRHAVFVLALLAGSIFIGMWGYEYFEHLPWRDAFVNTAMLLGGMGPVDPLKTDGGKVFAGLFALYSGLVFLIVAATLLAPVIHRILHRFHWEQGKK